MTQDVSNKPQDGLQPATLRTFRGAIIGLQGDVLHGWAIDIEHPDVRPVVEVFIDSVSVALARADQYEPTAPHGDQFHGFAIQLRQSWLNKAQMITAQIANQDLPLQGDIQLPAPPSHDSAAIASQVLHTGGLQVSGWSWDPTAPRRHVQVTLREGSRVIGQVTCNMHQQALAYRATSDHGFTFDLPWDLADGTLRIIDVVNDLGQPLAGSPIRLCCWPEGLEGMLQQLEPAPDTAALNLLTEVAKEQTLRLPKSAGWQHYPQWFEAFQKLNDSVIPARQGKLGILLISEGNSDLEKVSLKSMGTYSTWVHELIPSSPHNLLPALEKLIATGCDRILPLVAGDHLAPHAIPHLSALINNGSAWAYADCDRDGPLGERSLPWFKPIWDIDLFIGADIFTPGAIFSTSIIKQALLMLGSRGAQICNWYALIAGIALATEKSNASVSHLPYVLYHRAHSTAPSPEQDAPSELRQSSIAWMCDQLICGTQVSKVSAYSALLRAHWPLPEALPRVSVIVPTRDQFKLLHACLEGLLNHTDYPNLEIIVVNNQSTDTETLKYLEALSARSVKILDYPHQFNYSTINNKAVTIASGELVCLLNNDIEITHADWLKEMVSQLYRGASIVGAKLLWPNGMVQHAGVAVGINGLAAHSGNNWSENDAGYLGLNQIVRHQSAVTAACLLTTKATYQSLSGLDDISFPVAFNDVDFCLRALQSGRSIIWTPFAKLIHAESASRGKDTTGEKRARALREQTEFLNRWTMNGWQDNHYHVSLSFDYLSGPYGGLAVPPRL